MINDRALWRGKRTDTGDWVQGFLCPPTFPGRVTNEWYIAEETDNQFGYNGKMWIYEAIDLTTVGQCTGLKDKHGKSIFEGDIIRARETRGGFKPKKTVIWDESNRKFAVKWEEDLDCCSAFNSAFKSENIEIIGNIHDGEFAKGGEQHE